MASLATSPIALSPYKDWGVLNIGLLQIPAQSIESFSPDQIATIGGMGALRSRVTLNFNPPLKNVVEVVKMFLRSGGSLYIGLKKCSVENKKNNNLISKKIEFFFKSRREKNKFQDVLHPFYFKLFKAEESDFHDRLTLSITFHINEDQIISSAFNELNAHTFGAFERVRSELPCPKPESEQEIDYEPRSYTITQKGVENLSWTEGDYERVKRYSRLILDYLKAIAPLVKLPTYQRTITELEQRLSNDHPKTPFQAEVLSCLGNNIPPLPFRLESETQTKFDELTQQLQQQIEQLGQ